MDLKDYLRIIRRRLWYFVGFFVFILIMYAGWISWELEVWSAEAMITVKPLGHRNELVENLTSGSAAFLHQSIWREIFWLQRTEQLQFHSAVLLYLTLHQGEPDMPERLRKVQEGFRGEFASSGDESRIHLLRPLEELEHGLSRRVYAALTSSEVSSPEVRANLFGQERAGALREEEDPVQVIKRLREWIDVHVEVSADEQTGIVTIRAKAPNRLEAVVAANVVAGTAQMVEYRRKQEDYDKTVESLDGERRSTQREVADLRAAVYGRVQAAGIDINALWGLQDLPAAHDRANSERSVTEAQVLDFEAQLAEARAQVEFLNTSWERESQRPPTSPRLEEIASQVTSLRQTRDGLREGSGWTDEHPEMRRLAREIETLDQARGQAEQQVAEQRLADHHELLADAEFRQRVLEEGLANARERAARAKEQHEQLQALLELDHDAVTQIRELDSYQMQLANRLAGVKIAQKDELGSMDVSSVAQLERTNRAAKTSTRAWPFVFLIALVVSVFVVYLLEYLDTRIKSEHDVRRHVNLPVLAKIPKQPEGEEVLLPELDIRGKFAEVFNTAATLINSTARDLGLRSFVITSTKEEEGKTTIAIDLGVALARKGLRVILVDSDLRRPQMHDLLGLDNAVGLSSILEGRLKAKEVLGDITGAKEKAGLDDFLRATTEKNLRVLTSGPTPPDPVALIESVQMKALVEELKAICDYVVFDTPPIYHVGDALTLAPLTDANLLVIGAGLVDHHEVAWAKHLLSNVESNILGVILNLESEESQTYNYYYNYYTKTYRYR